MRIVVGVQREATLVGILHLDLSRLGDGAKWDIFAVLYH